MNRRSFLTAAAAALTGAALDPERLLWVPGQKTYFDITQPALPQGWVRSDIASLLVRGDVIQIDERGWRAGRPLPYLQDFVVTSDGEAGVDRIKLYPMMLTPKTSRKVNIKHFPGVPWQ